MMICSPFWIVTVTMETGGGFMVLFYSKCLLIMDVLLTSTNKVFSKKHSSILSEWNYESIFFFFVKSVSYGIGYMYCGII